MDIKVNVTKDDVGYIVFADIGPVGLRPGGRLTAMNPEFEKAWEIFSSHVLRVWKESQEGQ